MDMALRFPRVFRYMRVSFAEKAKEEETPMKRLIALLIALMLAALMVPALAETADTAAEETTEETSEAAEGAAEEAAESAETAAEETAEGEPAPQPSPIVKKLLEQKWYTWTLVAALIVAAVLLFFYARNAKWNTRQLAMGAMCIAISFVLSLIRLFRMPQGGSITPAAMLPLVLFTVSCGPIKGFIVGCACGFLHLVSDPYIIHPIQMLVDYPLAYGMIALSYVAVLLPVDKRWQLPLAALFGGLGRYSMEVLSGVVFFAEYAGDQNALVYSLVYNLSSRGPDTLVCAVAACIPGMNRLVDMIRRKH